MMSRKRHAGLSLFVLLVGTACGLSSAGNLAGGEGGEAPTPSPTAAPVLPVSINEGLASLDSYRMTYVTDSFDSASQERSVVTLVVSRDGATDTDYTRTETRVTGAGAEVLSEDVQEQYLMGSQVCAVAGGEAEATTISGAARALSDLMAKVVVFNPLIENPVCAGRDIVSGVPVRTCTFEVRSVGAGSEVEVARADGTYAIADDGDYLVHYRLDMELRTAVEGSSEAQVSTLAIEVSLDQINQPTGIVIPEGCQIADPSGG